MTNLSMRERFGLSEGSSNSVSQIITATIDQGLIKRTRNAPDSRRYARYIPAWASPAFSMQPQLNNKIIHNPMIFIVFSFTTNRTTFSR